MKVFFIVFFGFFLFSSLNFAAEVRSSRHENLLANFTAIYIKADGTISLVPQDQEENFEFLRLYINHKDNLVNQYSSFTKKPRELDVHLGDFVNQEHKDAEELCAILRLVFAKQGSYFESRTANFSHQHAKKLAQSLSDSSSYPIFLMELKDMAFHIVGLLDSVGINLTPPSPQQAKVGRIKKIKNKIQSK